MSPFYNYVDTSQGLSKFLERPVLLRTINWTSSLSTTTSFNPWQELCAEPAYLEKLKYFSGIRADVKIKVILNGTPFHYGRAIMCYLPLTGPVSGVMRASYTGRIIDSPLMSGYYGVRHCILDPTLSTPVEMTLPYQGPDDFSQFTGSAAGNQNYSSIDTLGTVVVGIQAQLASASTAVPEPVTIQIYGWFTNITLGPVTPYYLAPVVVEAVQLPALERRSVEDETELREYEVQGGEAIGTGPVSKIASAVANAANALSNVPIIGRFAKATEIGSKAIGGIATLFGFSLPSVIQRYEVVKSELATNFAFTSGRDSSWKLTLDPLQELTVDPVALGLPDSRDQMAYTHLYKIPTVIRNMTWTVGAAEGTCLSIVPVTPAYTPCVNPNGYPRTYYPSPLNGLALCHERWTGRLKYRIEVVCSAYHKGRLQIRYVPFIGLRNLNPATPLAGFGEPTSQTIIMDLSVDHKKEFEVGWASPGPTSSCGVLLACSDIATQYAANGSSLNGAFTVEILTKLTAPQTVAPVQIYIFMEGTEDLKFIGPTNVYASQVEIQGGEPEVASTGGDITCVQLGGPSKIPGNFDSVVYGESVNSLRALLKRFVPLGRHANIVDAAGRSGIQIITATFGLDYPLTESGFSYPIGLAPFSLVYNTYFNFWKLSYVGAKGGTRYKVFVGPGDANLSAVSPQRAVVWRDKSGFINGFIALTPSTILQKAGMGYAVMNTTNETIEFEVPDYDAIRYRVNNRRNTTYSGSSRQMVTLGVQCTINSTLAGQVIGEVMVAGAEDFSLLDFYACPPVVLANPWIYTTLLK